jgi:uncharacterized protein YecE (DUF72 family)
MTEEQLAFGWEEEEARPAAPPVTARAARLAARLADLARQGVYLGTSSWKYPGWLGQVYQADRYHVRGRFSRKKFEHDCLEEYARVFPTVCGDFAFYQFPSPRAWDDLFTQLPAGYRFSLKVPEDVTVSRFPDLPRYGRRAGTDNPHFMDAGIMKDRLLEPLDRHRDRLGVLILEFGAIREGPAREPAAFTRRLDGMLSRLPVDRFRLGVEVRNPEFLAPSTGYLDCLRAHGVAHCLNSWTRMPALGEQLDTPGILTAPHAVARLLLRPGRTYEQAVRKFSPYERIQDPYDDGRAALRRLIERCRQAGQMLFAFVNNRFEGSAVETIERAIDLPDAPATPPAQP